MTIRRATLVASPDAGHGTELRVAYRAAGLLRAQNLGVEVIIGDNRADTADLAGKAARGDTDVIVVVGGDGMVRLTIEATIGSGKPLAVIPAGAGNAFARDLGIPLDPAGAVEVILAGHRRPIDLGRVSFPDGRTALFTTFAATGLVPEITARALRLRWPGPRARRAISALSELAATRSRHYHIRVDDYSVEYDAFLAAMENTISYQAGIVVTPRASSSDGQIDITFASNPAHLARRAVAWSIPKLVHVGSYDNSDVRTMRGSQIELYCDPPALVSADGDLVGQLPAVFEASPHVIEVFVPATG